MLERVHPIAATIAFLTILTFWTSTVLSELLGSLDAVVTVKQAIPWGLLILVPALAVTGASGFRLAGNSAAPLIARKKRRMPFIAANGLLVLVPSALGLSALAGRGELGGLFYAVQAVELVAGAANITMMASNIRDGLQLTGRLRRARADEA